MLASGKVRQVGEMIAMCVAETRAEAEDIAAQVEVDFDELPAVVDMLDGARMRDSRQPLVHEHWGDNVFLESLVDIGGADGDRVRRTAPSVSTARCARRARAWRRSKAAVWSRTGTGGSRN